LHVLDSQPKPVAQGAAAEHAAPCDPRHVSCSQVKPNTQSDATPHAPPAVRLQAPDWHWRPVSQSLVAPHTPFRPDLQKPPRHVVPVTHGTLASQPMPTSAAQRLDWQVWFVTQVAPLQAAPGADLHTFDWHTSEPVQSSSPAQAPPVFARQTPFSQVRPVWHATLAEQFEPSWPRHVDWVQV